MSVMTALKNLPEFWYVHFNKAPFHNIRALMSLWLHQKDLFGKLVVIRNCHSPFDVTQNLIVMVEELLEQHNSRFCF
jgi:hypothetical protein